MAGASANLCCGSSLATEGGAIRARPKPSDKIDAVCLCDSVASAVARDGIQAVAT